MIRRLVCYAYIADRRRSSRYVHDEEYWMSSLLIDDIDRSPSSSDIFSSMRVER